jgi:SAM-dependent methyltransferase
MMAALRRFVDLQAGSGWRDLKIVLPHVTGIIVDAGCGAQPYRSLVPPAATYIGIGDAKSKDRFGDDVPDARYFNGDHWPIADSSVDLVLCTETLEHMPDSRQFLEEAFRCLAPDGTILITVPFAAPWHFIPHDYWCYTPSGLFLPFVPAFLLIAMLVNWSLLRQGGDDCIGYTAMSERRSS